MEENNNENITNNENIENNEKTPIEENFVSEESLITTENNSQEESNNSIKISNDAVATYVGIAIAEVPGVYGTSGTLAGITEAISGKKSYTKGVKVDIDEQNVKIDVNIIVEYGARIPDVAFEIQTKVKKSVEVMTGLKVLEVNVNVQGVHAITEKDENTTEEA